MIYEMKVFFCPTNRRPRTPTTTPNNTRQVKRERRNQQTFTFLIDAAQLAPRPRFTCTSKKLPWSQDVRCALRHNVHHSVTHLWTRRRDGAWNDPLIPQEEAT